MARKIPIAGDMTAIGEVKTPPFARTPDPTRLFERRAARFRALADDTGIGPYLGFLAGLVAAQHEVARELPEAEPVAEEALARAVDHGMPPLDRNGFAPDALLGTITDHLFTRARTLDMPEQAARALERVATGRAETRLHMIGNVLADSIPVEAMAEHVYVAAALQVRFTHAASALPERRLKSVADGAACPACGGPPVSSVIVGWPQAGGTRFCACALCSTMWHHVRVKCVLCSSTKGIKYQEIEGGPGSIKAETCDNCGCYVKILNQQKDVSLEPLADDVGSLAIDLLMKESRFRRGAFNPFLLGY
ncbi:formate dehydrogenase accessory protein FdhE [Aureimonas populi]|uniref:Protein FdhE homolog n=1 Tax=Aureimonas populi TaxID=1701758 RepID=A0ABW5CMJ6_9HYPH|nr:formate dehydrogenase accessory protein FdhE [Aureimonas populi]